MDSWLEPGATIGAHQHDRTEEIYYVLAGELQVGLDYDGQQQTQVLGPQDSHRVPRGGRHWATAGSEGARFIVVAVAV